MLVLYLVVFAAFSWRRLFRRLVGLCWLIVIILLHAVLSWVVFFLRKLIITNFEGFPSIICEAFLISHFKFKYFYN